MSRPRRECKPWSAFDVNRAARHRVEGLAYKQIARLVGRSPRAVQSKLAGYYERSVRRPEPKFHMCKVSYRPPTQVIEARDVRYAAALQRDLTGSVFGDPPKGFSALDQMQGSLA